MERHEKNTNAYQAQRKADYFAKVLGKLSPTGVNGGHIVANGSKDKKIAISGSSWINGQETKTKELFLQPGQMIVGKRIETIGSDGKKDWNYDGNIVDMASGITVKSNVGIGIYDVDAIGILPGQTYEYEGNTYSINDTENYAGLLGEIKTEAGWSSALDAKIKGAPTTGLQNGLVLVQDLPNGNLTLTTWGVGIGNRPSIKFGDRIKKR